MPEDRSVAVAFRDSCGAVVRSSLEHVQVDDVATGVPIREFRWYRGRQHYSGWYWSATTGRLVAYESLLELDRILLADFAPDVLEIAAQPFQIAGPDGDRQRRHVPDLLLKHADGKVTVVDVKPARKLPDPKVREVFAWTDRLVGTRGWSFEVFSGGEATVMGNLRFLAGYRRSMLIDRTLESVVLEAAAAKSTIAALERSLSDRIDPLRVRPVILHLLWRGALSTDLSAPLAGASPIRVVRVVEHG